MKILYPSVENFYQAMKFSPDQYHRFISISPADAKHLASTMDMIFSGTDWNMEYPAHPFHADWLAY